MDFKLYTLSVNYKHKLQHIVVIPILLSKCRLELCRRVRGAALIKLINARYELALAPFFTRP
jgi:hypothetical protein